MKTTVTGLRMCSMPKTHGFTMLEFLITLLIVSLSLLGIAGIIANSLKYNQSAYFRSQAVFLAGDIVDRMRANRTTAEDTVALPYNLAMGSPAASPCVPASADAIAQSDLTAWCDALAAALPSGSGSVDLDPVTRTVTVVVQWNDSRAAGGSNAEQTLIETRL